MNLIAMSTVRCRLCNGQFSTAVLNLTGMPRSNHRLLKPSELQADQGIDLTVYQCQSCGFVSVPAQLNSDYYDDYVNAPSTSPQMQAFQRAQASEFVERFNLFGKTILEIGCGDGFFLEALSAQGAVCTGIEPSDTQRSLALSRNLNVEAGLLTPEKQLSGRPFDAFVTRQVFEHVEDMQGFLLAIRNNLKDRAIGLVEVPNLEKLVSDGRFFDFIPEHLNYFSRDSLRLVLELSGFDVLEVTVVQEGEAIRAIVRLKQHASFDGVGRMVSVIRESITTYIAECKSLGERVAIWGAGGKGLSMLAVADLTGVDLLIDRDPYKLGCYTPVSHLKVSSPEVLRAVHVHAIIITAPAYQYEILRELHDIYGFKGKIAIIENGLKVLQ